MTKNSNFLRFQSSVRLIEVGLGYEKKESFARLLGA